jgi:hypothetical protein
VTLTGVGTGTFSSNFSLAAAAVAGSAPITITINNGSPTGTLTGTLTGSLALLAQILAGTPNVTAPATITISSGAGGFAGATGSFNVTATGTGAGTTGSGAGTFTIAGPGSIIIPGSGTAPKLALSTNALAFGNVKSGQTMDMSVVVSNTGTAALTVSSLTVGGAGFSVITSSGLAVQPGGVQNVTVRFAPTAAGNFSGSLLIGSNDPASPATVNLTGTGVVSSTSDVTLKVDGGVFNQVFGFVNGQTGAAFVNRLTPPSYPATLKNVQIYFGNRANGLTVGTPITLIYGSNPSGSAAFNATLTLLPAQVTQVGAFNTYTVAAPLTITSGDFIVGLQMDNPPGVYPLELDTTTPSQQRSYYAAGNLTFTQLDTIGSPGNLAIRAVATVGGQ